MVSTLVTRTSKVRVVAKNTLKHIFCATARDDSRSVHNSSQYTQESRGSLDSATQFLLAAPKHLKGKQSDPVGMGLVTLTE